MQSDSYLDYNALHFGNAGNFTLKEAVESRRTVRKYKTEPVSHDITQEILKLSTHAPSNCNKQGWRFIIIDNQKHLQWLYENGSAAFVPKAPHAVLVCYLKFTENEEWSDNLQSASAAITYFQVIAHTYGIGSCWVNHLPPKKQIARYFSIPAKYEPIALITYGYYPDNIKLIKRTPKDGLASLNKWDMQDDDLVSDKSFKNIVRKTARKIYYAMPFRKYLRNLTHKFEKKFDNEEK